MWKRGEIAPKEQFLLFSTLFSVYLFSGVKLHIHLWNVVVWIIFFLKSANLICRDTDISKYFRESFGLRDNESTVLLNLLMKTESTDQTAQNTKTLFGLRSQAPITKTYLYKFPLKPHFYIVKLGFTASCKSALNPTVVYSTDRPKAVVTVVVLLFVALWFILRFVVCLSVCHFVLVFFSPFSIAITSLGEERANLSAFRTFVRFVLVWICRFPLPVGVWEGLRFVIVALPGLFSYLFFYTLLFWFLLKT